jgi:hypothetical protein
MCLVCACVEPVSDPDTDGGAVLVAPVDLEEYCNIVGAREVIVRATEDLCEGSCVIHIEPRTFEGDAHSCPATRSSELLGVEVDTDARYVVQAIVVLTTDEEVAQQCYARPGEAPSVVVTSDDIETGAHILLEAAGNTCTP